MDMDQTILVVEDENEIRQYITQLLREEGYLVSGAESGTEALKFLEKRTPHLIILDLNLPDISGEGVCREVRKEHPMLPIIMLTARDAVSDKVNGFQAGADDYVSKPFIPEELIARVKARLRKTDGNDVASIVVGDLSLDPRTMEVKRGAKAISLTPREFKLLHYLMTNVGIVLTRDMILSRIWMSSPDVETRVVDVYMGYLRKKIDKGSAKKLIHSIRGFGYTLKP
jgi:DNA-binding response OmpR family regulator